MKILDRLFGQAENEQDEPQIPFGRYTDSYKTSEQYNAWDQALEAFEKGEYIQSYLSFFKYLCDPEVKNVNFEHKNGNIEFEIIQGSKKVIGQANARKFKAEAKVAYADSLNIGYMRRLMEQNYDLKYSRYALDDENDITILFDTYTLDGSPYKLYYALKEVATNADKLDDLLLDEFSMLRPTEATHLKEIPDSEKEIKYQYILREANAIFDEIDNGKLDHLKYPGGIAYLLLNLFYKLDYLTRPEGYMMEALERSNRLYFAKDGKNDAQKNQTLRKELEKLVTRPKEQFFKELYQVLSTFGITSPVNHDKVVSFIDGELHYMDWYKEHGHDEVALSIPGYIVGFCLFNYAVPKPDRDYMHLYFRIVESDYFKQLGFGETYFDKSSRKFDRKAIKKAIRRVVEANQSRYPNLNPQIAKLNYDSLSDFAKSYLLMIRNLDMSRID